MVYPPPCVQLIRDPIKDVHRMMIVKYSRLIQCSLNSSVNPVITASSPPICTKDQNSLIGEQSDRLTAESRPSVMSMTKKRRHQNFANGRVEMASG